MFGGFSTTRSKKKTDEIIEVITPPEDKDSQWDLNDDGKLDEKELTHLKRADAGKLERYLEADVDGDGVLSNNELRLAEEGEDQFARLKTLRKIKEAYVFRRNKKRDYMSLFLFSVFLGLYLGILYEQTEATSAYGIVWTMQNSIVPQNENTDEDALVYSARTTCSRGSKGPSVPSGPTRNAATASVRGRRSIRASAGSDAPPTAGRIPWSFSRRSTSTFNPRTRLTRPTR